MNEDSASGEASELAVRAAGDSWAVVGRLVRRLRELAGDGDLTPSQTSVLMRLAKGGPATASDLAGAERVRPQSMAKTVAVLEEAGLAGRSPDPDDGRRQLVSLTDAGRERFQGDRRSRQEWLARTLQERCSDEELRKVVEVMALLDDVAQS
ncbi:MarR family winged helix-turn-helix transcriptional regulator [Streptomyces beijiangensis]|uniref:MarR family transcriptional regulator n=1 Tax=Streptomyces beijiangensis TaxID=163361 RepID=A0A939F918_9ACTN|nr:MarR family transcriptional regulator [Streptomyces beijiangensis]MBO0514168.1 MarR family transcriptional regulator [Streptomyces beijiangensis]